jgi:hypothetical protein
LINVTLLIILCQPELSDFSRRDMPIEIKIASFRVKKRDIMKTIKYYHNAHLFVSAIRVLEHQKSTPPLIEDVCTLLSFSLEQGHFICKKLEEMGIVEVVEGGYGIRLFIKDHLAIENIPKDGQESRLEEALKDFQASKNVYQKKVASIKADQEKKKQNLFADLEKKLKQDLGKKR